MADDWIFDLILQFLKSPLWSHPVQTYIDENCYLFDGASENSLVMTNMHQQFRDVVDKVLGDHLEALGIPGDEFVAACDNNTNKELHALVSEYILALDDFVIFKKMMEKRNVELELESMRMMKFGLFPEAPEKFFPQEDPAETLRRQREEEENAMLEAAIAESIQGSDVYQKELQMEDAQLEHALAISLALEEERIQKLEEDNARLAKEDAKKAEEEKMRIEAEHKATVEALQANYQAEKASILHRKEAAAPPPVPVAIPTSDSDAPSDARSAAASGTAPTASKTLQTATLGNVKLGPLGAIGGGNLGAGKAVLPGISRKSEAAAPTPATTPAPAPASAPAAKPVAGADEMAKRAEHMKQQRARLLAAKKQERNKELEAYEKEQEAAAKSPKKGEPLTEDQKKVAEMRLALARRFKEDLLSESKRASA